MFVNSFQLILMTLMTLRYHNKQLFIWLVEVLLCQNVNVQSFIKLYKGLYTRPADSNTEHLL